MHYVVQIKSDESIVRFIYVGKDDAMKRCAELKERWPLATFDVFNEAGLDNLPNVCC